MKPVAAAFQALRPKQWTKNGFLFPALVFSQHMFDRPYVLRALAAYGLFCALSSCGYLFNDLRDVEADRRHPTKRHRPIASGTVPVPVAIALMGALGIGGIALSFRLNPAFGIAAASYLAMTLSYTLVFKHMVLLDVMFIALGFLLRAVAGAAAISVPISPWFLLCAAFLALFLGFSKRLSEIRLLEAEAAAHRRNLKDYSEPLLGQIINVVIACTILSYAMASFDSGHTPWLMLTIPFVIYAIFRYMYLVDRHQEGGAPDMTLLKDRPLQVTILLYLLTAVAVLQYEAHQPGGEPGASAGDVSRP